MRRPDTTRTSRAARPKDTAGAAEPIIQEALLGAQAVASNEKNPARKSWSARRLARIGIAMASALLMIGMGRAFLWNADHARFNRDQLDRVSPYLSHGARNGEGQGPAFVGEIRDSWSALDEADQRLVATDLVEALRETGVRDVMIYDNDGFLRIQALGEQSPRMLGAPKPGR